jgi:HK97 family phage major capsid protein
VAAYTIVDRLGITVERYDDATTASTNSVKYVMRRRLGGQLLEPYRLTTLKIATS